MKTREILQKYYDLSRDWNRTFCCIRGYERTNLYYSNSITEMEKRKNDTVVKLGDDRLKKIQDEFNAFMDMEWEEKK